MHLQKYALHIDTNHIYTAHTTRTQTYAIVIAYQYIAILFGK